MNYARNVALLALAGVLLATPMLSGCKAMKKEKRAESMVLRLKNAPPIRTETLGDNHMLVMQAPNPGWSYKLDRDDRDRDGWVVWITIRKPDPAYMYPQRIVEKRLLTQVDADQPIRVMARMLEHNERGNSDQYAPLPLTNQVAP